MRWIDLQPLSTCLRMPSLVFCFARVCVLLEKSKWYGLIFPDTMRHSSTHFRPFVVPILAHSTPFLPSFFRIPYISLYSLIYSNIASPLLLSTQNPLSGLLSALNSSFVKPLSTSSTATNSFTLIICPATCGDTG